MSGNRRFRHPAREIPVSRAGSQPVTPLLPSPLLPLLLLRLPLGPSLLPAREVGLGFVPPFLGLIDAGVELVEVGAFGLTGGRKAGRPLATEPGGEPASKGIAPIALSPRP